MVANGFFQVAVSVCLASRLENLAEPIESVMLSRLVGCQLREIIIFEFTFENHDRSHLLPPRRIILEGILSLRFFMILLRTGSLPKLTLQEFATN